MFRAGNGSNAYFTAARSQQCGTTSFERGASSQHIIYDENTRFTQAMREQIDLADYSKEIKHFDVVPILFPDRDHFHEEALQYDPQTRTVTLQLLIDPDRLAEATLETYPALLGEVLYEKGRQLSVVPEPLLARMRAVLAGMKGEA